MLYARTGHQWRSCVERPVLRPMGRRIDLDPYPTYRRLRDENRIYHNERHDFWGLSRAADVDAALGAAAAQLCQGRHPRGGEDRPGHPAGGFRRRGPAAAHDAPGAGGTRVHAEEDARLSPGAGFCAAAWPPGRRRSVRLRAGPGSGVADEDHRHARRDSRRRSAVGACRSLPIGCCATKPGQPLPVNKDHYFDGRHVHRLRQVAQEEPVR